MQYLLFFSMEVSPKFQVFIQFIELHQAFLVVTFIFFEQFNLQDMNFAEF